jgi:hypothetical protein
VLQKVFKSSPVFHASLRADFRPYLGEGQQYVAASVARVCMEAKHVLRTLLRAVDKNVTAVAHNKSWRDYIITKFRENRQSTDTDRIARELQLCKDYAKYVTNIATHKQLLKEYNIGIDVDERTKRMIEVTARRVGFALPNANR